MQGWISLHRILLEKPIWQNSTPEQKSILITILLLANHKPNKWEWMGKPYQCQAGEFISSHQHIANLSGKGISVQNVRTAIKRFEKLEFLTNQSTNGYKDGIKLCIVNWAMYQNQSNRPPNSLQTDNQQFTNTHLTTNNNVNNGNNENKDDFLNFQNSSSQKNYYNSNVCHSPEKGNLKNKHINNEIPNLVGNDSDRIKKPRQRKGFLDYAT